MSLEEKSLMLVMEQLDVTTGAMQAGGVIY